MLVNVIGGYHSGEPVAELPHEVLREQLDLNLMTAFGLTKAVLNRMDPDVPGRIVHVSSRAARDSGANAFAYSVSKLAMLRLIEAVAAETRGTAISINAILQALELAAARRRIRQFETRACGAAEGQRGVPQRGGGPQRGRLADPKGSAPGKCTQQGIWPGDRETPWPWAQTRP